VVGAGRSGALLIGPNMQRYCDIALSTLGVDSLILLHTLKSATFPPGIWKLRLDFPDPDRPATQAASLLLECRRSPECGGGSSHVCWGWICDGLLPSQHASKSDIRFKAEPIGRGQKGRLIRLESRNGPGPFDLPQQFRQ
jgi:hypothetical protein